MEKLKVHKKVIQKRKKAKQNKTPRKFKFKTQLQKLKRIQRFLSFFVQNYDFDFILQKNFNIKDNRFPYKIINMPCMFGSPDQVEKSIDMLLNINNSNPIDISVSQNKEFSGHYLEHNTTSQTFRDFLNYEGPYNLYLAQFPLYEKQNTLRESNLLIKEQSFENEKSLLQKLFDKEKDFLKICLKLKGNIHRVNLWFSKKETFSHLHYDSYDNFLFMLKGKKIFNLFPPNDYSIKCESVLTNSFQQSKQLCKSRRKLQIELKNNEAIFIPQGWYHDVSSFGEGNIIAVNIWFNSIEDICNQREKYLFRYLTSKLLDNEIQKLLKHFTKSLINSMPQTDFKMVFTSQIIKERAYYILKKFSKDPNFGLKLFILTVSQIPVFYFRTFILSMLNLNSNCLKTIFLSLDIICVEFFTNKMELVDTIIPSSFQGPKDLNFVTIDDFYITLNEKMDFAKVTEYFLFCKKQLKKRVLKSILFEKLSNSYKF